jgi:MGT family glycosyltransferase
VSKYLFALPDAGGAVPPVLSVAGALVRRGHDVRVLTDPVVRAEVEAVGARHVAWTHAPHRHTRDKDSDIAKDWEARTPLGAMAVTRDGFLVGPAAEYARDTLAELEREPADALASEMLPFGAMIAGQAAGVPVAVLLTTILPLPVSGRPPFGPGFMPARGPAGRLRDAAVSRLSSAQWNKALPKLNATRAAYGLPPLGHLFEQVATADRVLALTSEAFDFPATAPLPSNVRYVGPRLDDPAWAGEWSPPPGDAPLVLVGTSSTYQDHTSLLGRIANALGSLPVRGLITTGPAVAPEEVDAPANVSVVAAAPHGQVLREAAAVVTHAGHGTVIRALSHGVPLVALPIGRDQPDVAARLVASGAGLRLRPGSSAAKIAAAVGRVLHEPAFGVAAHRIADAIAAEVAQDRAAEELEALVDDGRRTPTAAIADNNPNTPAIANTPLRA